MPVKKPLVVTIRAVGKILRLRICCQIVLAK